MHAVDVTVNHVVERPSCTRKERNCRDVCEIRDESDYKSKMCLKNGSHVDLREVLRQRDFKDSKGIKHMCVS